MISFQKAAEIGHLIAQLHGNHESLRKLDEQKRVLNAEGNHLAGALREIIKEEVASLPRPEYEDFLQHALDLESLIKDLRTQNVGDPSQYIRRQPIAG